MTLADQFDSRRNAITPLRLVLALLVVFTHAYELGNYGPDPAQRYLGVSCGEFGVNAFFALSGFLVTQSFCRSPTIPGYFWKRALRILPGFWACLLLCAFVLAPMLLQMGGQTRFFAFFASPGPLSFVWRNAALIMNRTTIPPLFSGQPANGIIDGSLWSLFPEALCYAGVVVIGMFGFFDAQSFSRSRRLRRSPLPAVEGGSIPPLPPRVEPRLSRLFFALLLGTALLIQGWLTHHIGELNGRAWLAGRYAVQASFFLAGMSAWLFAKLVPLRPLYVGSAATLLLLMSFLFGYGWGAPLLVTYLVLGIAIYWPVDRFDRFGDWSYGVYIYHYPVLQSLWFFGLHPSYPATFFLWALLPTALLAGLSWHLIEAPALRWKTRLASRLI